MNVYQFQQPIIVENIFKYSGSSNVYVSFLFSNASKKNHYYSLLVKIAARTI